MTKSVLAVEQSEVIALLEHGFRNIELPPLDKADMQEIADGLARFLSTRTAIAALPDPASDGLRDALRLAGRKLMSIEDAVPTAREAQLIILAALAKDTAP